MTSKHHSHDLAQAFTKCAHGSNSKPYLYALCMCVFYMRGSRKFCQYHYKLAIIGPSAKRHLNGVSLACRRWLSIACWLGSFVIFWGSRPVLLRNLILLGCDFSGGGGSGPPVPPLDSFYIAKKPYTFVIFQGGGGSGSPAPPPSGSAHVLYGAFRISSCILSLSLYHIFMFH